MKSSSIPAQDSPDRADPSRIKITKIAMERMTPPEPGSNPAFYWDTELKGFGVRVTASGVKSFILQKRVKGKEKRETLGRYGELTPDQARKRAKELAGVIATGRDPYAEQRDKTLKATTLGQVFTDYLEVKKNLKPKTRKDYQRAMDTALKNWKDKPLLSISKEKVVKRHVEVGAEHGEAWANQVMRLLRALFNFAAEQYEDGQGRSLVPDNPVKRLSHTRAWYKETRRQTVIKPHEIKAWFQAVMVLDNPTVRDYLIVLLLTGLRKGEAAKLQWKDVDLKDRTLTILNPKNGKTLALPLSDYLHEILEARKDNANGDYVFPGSGKGGYLVEPRKQMEKVTAASGVGFTLHDLRRTFITTVESLDISAYALKRLVNHSTGHDVTAGYIVTSVERLRDPMQRVTDFLLKTAGVTAIVSCTILPKPDSIAP